MGQIFFVCSRKPIAVLNLSQFKITWPFTLCTEFKRCMRPQPFLTHIKCGCWSRKIEPHPFPYVLYLTEIHEE